jgi:GTP pyrophosphokinase
MATSNISTVENNLVKETLYLNTEDQVLVSRALRYAKSAHNAQLRMSGDEYIRHPIEVARILAELHMDGNTLATALLHDILEDTETTYQELEKDFGVTIAKLVNGVTKLDKLSAMSSEQIQAENIRKMLLAMSEDVRVVLVKLADRLHNMRTLEFLSPERQQRIARQTLDIYAPLAHRLGIGQIKWELEDLSFSYLYPGEYKSIVSQFTHKRKEREQYLTDTEEIIGKELERIGIKGSISGRPKHVYSIWRKMEKLDKTFEEIYDLNAIRVSVATIPDCYGTLGVIHSLWKPIPGRFKDYIAMPKSNGYQSLHTTVISLSGESLEIQIRTYEMDTVAEFGVAAHWHYKEGSKPDTKTNEKLAWVRLLLDWQTELLDAEQFVDAIKFEIFEDEVFVFTPKGEVQNLPTGSTPVDFAYRIHTEVGHRCIGAKVNKLMVTLDTTLENGDIVEILTTKTHHGPSRDWLTFAKTSSAREKIRQWFKQERREENITRGKELLDKELKRVQKRNLGSVNELLLKSISVDLGYKELDEFLAAIGYGELSAQSILLKLAAKEPQSEQLLSPLPPLPQNKKTVSGKISVLGTSNALTNLAACCHPLPGDLIQGYVTRGKGVSVHKADCSNIRRVQQPERLVMVSWEPIQHQLFPVSIVIRGDDRPGLLRDVATTIAANNTNMQGAEAKTVPIGGNAMIKASVNVSSLKELSKLLGQLESIKSVHSVQRES